MEIPDPDVITEILDQAKTKELYDLDDLVAECPDIADKLAGADQGEPGSPEP